MQDWCIYLFVCWFVGFYFIILKKILFNSEVILDFFLDIGRIFIFKMRFKSVGVRYYLDRIIFVVGGVMLFLFFRLEKKFLVKVSRFWCIL